MWFVYILLCSDGSFYTGSTNNVEKRFKDHVLGRGARYTKSHKPLKVIYREKFDSKSDTFKREVQIKKMTKTQKESLISGDY